MQKLIAKTLEQQERSGYLGRRFNINAQNFIDIQIGLKTQAFRYPVNILFLDPAPAEKTVFAWKWIFTSMLFALLTLLFAYLYITPANMVPVAEQYASYLDLINPWKTESLAGSTVLMLIAVLISKRKTQKFIILKSRYGQVPVVKFFKDMPDKQSVNDFIREIRHRSEQMVKKSKRNAEEILSAELEGLRNLRDHKIISDKEYDKAKQTIMKKHASLDRNAINKSRKNKLEIAQYQ